MILNRPLHLLVHQVCLADIFIVTGTVYLPLNRCRLLTRFLDNPSLVTGLLLTELMDYFLKRMALKRNVLESTSSLFIRDLRAHEMSGGGDCSYKFGRRGSKALPPSFPSLSLPLLCSCRLCS